MSLKKSKQEQLQKNICNNVLFDRITRLYFVLAILILFIHTSNLSYYGLECGDFSSFPWIVEQFIGVGLGDICVPTFFMLSGYLFFRNIDVFQEKFIKDVLIKQRKRIISLGVPYLIWNTIGTLFYMLVPRIPKIGSLMNGSAVDITALNILKGVFLHEYYFPFWYLASLLILVCLSLLVAVLFKTKAWGILTLVALAVGGLFSLGIPELECRFAFFYCLGAYFAIHCRTAFEKRPSMIACAFSMIILILCVGVRAYSDLSKIGLVFLYVSPCCYWVLSSGLSYKTGPFVRQSFFVYACHIIIVSSINRILQVVGDTSTLWIVLSYFLTPAITLIIIYFVYRLLSRLTPMLYSTLCGGRAR